MITYSMQLRLPSTTYLMRFICTMFMNLDGDMTAFTFSPSPLHCMESRQKDIEGRARLGSFVLVCCPYLTKCNSTVHSGTIPRLKVSEHNCDTQTDETDVVHGQKEVFHIMCCSSDWFCSWCSRCFQPFRHSKAESYYTSVRLRLLQNVVTFSLQPLFHILHHLPTFPPIDYKKLTPLTSNIISITYSK